MDLEKFADSVFVAVQRYVDARLAALRKDIDERSQAIETVRAATLREAAQLSTDQLDARDARVAAGLRELRAEHTALSEFARQLNADLEALRNALAKQSNGDVENLLQRLIVLEGTAPFVGPPGEKGDAGPQGERGEKGDAGPQGEKGDAGPQGERGEKGDAGPQGERGEKGDAGPQGERGEKGADADTGLVFEAARAQVAEQLEGLWPEIEKRVEAAVAQIEVVVPKPVDGKDGADGRDGRDGRDGVDGRDALDLALLPAIDPAKAYARGTWACWRGGLVMATRNTTPLGDGDALAAGWACCVRGLDSLTVEYDGVRQVTVRAQLTDEEVVRTVKMPVMLDRGVWAGAKEYEQGDSVSYDGSIWIAQRATTEKPGASDGWRLSVKHGRDGRDAPQGARDPQRVSLK